jgi:hypothetical protein
VKNQHIFVFAQKLLTVLLAIFAAFLPFGEINAQGFIDFGAYQRGRDLANQHNLRDIQAEHLMRLHQQRMDQERRESFSRYQAACLNSTAPNGSKIRSNEFIFDVAKEYCMCVSDTLVSQPALLFRDNNPQREVSLNQLLSSCRERTLTKREPEALEGLNRMLLSKNLPPVKSFPWHLWFN